MTPVSVDVTPDGPITLTVGQSRTLAVNVQPSDAPQDVTATTDPTGVVTVTTE